jgi:nitrite reductase/ring-hydroxylating ferredoxin subunit
MKVSVCWISYIILSLISPVNSFNLVMMGRRGKGNLKKSLQGESVSKRKVDAVNQGKGQEITGVSLPAERSIKGWEFGDKKTMVCANVDGRFYALQGACPRCAFDLFKGDLIADDPGWEDLPRVACPTCATTYSLASGKYGPPLKRKGLAGFVGNLAKTATQGDKPMDAEAFQITLDDEERVYCRSKTKPQPN